MGGAFLKSLLQQKFKFVFIVGGARLKYHGIIERSFFRKGLLNGKPNDLNVFQGFLVIEL